MAGDEERPSSEQPIAAPHEGDAPDAPQSAPGAVDETIVGTPRERRSEAEAFGASSAATPTTRGSMMPTLLSVIGVVLILLLAANLYTLYNPPGNDALRTAVADVGALKPRLAAAEASAGAIPALDQRVAALAGQVDQLKTAVARGNGGADARAAMAPLQARAGELDGKVAALETGSAALDSKAAALDTKVADLDRKAADLGKGLAVLQGVVAALPKVDLSPLDARVAALDKRLGPLEAYFQAPKNTEQVTEVRQNGSAAETRAAPLAVIAQGVLSALDGGRPFATEVEALAKLGVDAPTLAPLRAVAAKGAATRSDLAAGFAGVQDAVVVAAAPVETGTMFDRIMANAEGLVKVNRTGAEPGDDAAAIASRISDALKRGDLPAAAAAWDALPAPSKARSAAWADQLKARLKAEDAAHSIETKAVAALAAAQ